MSIVNFYRKQVSLVALVAFVGLLFFWANPSPAAPTAPVPEKNSTAAAADSNDKGTGFIEEEEAIPAVKKGKKTPWLLIGAALIVGAAAVYFLVLKKPKYTLNVSLTGATGTPATTAKYKKGTAVAYSYTASSGFVNLEVKLDGTTVAAAGTINMDKDHTLSVTAIQGANIQVNSNPTGAKIYLDNQDTGLVTNNTITSVTPGSHTVKLTMSGYNDYSATVNAVSGQTAVVNATLFRAVSGSWSGTTNQGNPVSFNVSGNAVTSYQIKMKLSGAGTLTLTVSGWGTYYISNGNFNISAIVGAGGTLTVSGKFNSAGTSLTGTWSCNYFYPPYGYFSGSGSYNATKTGSTPPQQVDRRPEEGVKVLEQHLE